MIAATAMRNEEAITSETRMIGAKVVRDEGAMTAT
jgi:hypothetical protein